MIQRLRRVLPARDRAVLSGLGEDAAVLRPKPGRVLLATTDLLLEGVHFDFRFLSWGALGKKAMASNLSDLAAMGGVPRFALIALAVPGKTRVADVDRLYRGMRAWADPFRVDLVGGDTSRSECGVFLALTLLGEGAADRVVCRAGASPGDALYVTGTLGDSAAGLELLQASGARGVSGKGARHLIRRHRDPAPRVREGQLLAGIASAMIDVSDGLLQDLGHLCEESRVAAEVMRDQVPLSPALRGGAGELLRHPPWWYALGGGEDYELLFAVPAAKEAALLRLIRSGRLRAARIGVFRRGRPRVTVRDARGRVVEPLPAGFDHFRES